MVPAIELGNGPRYRVIQGKEGLQTSADNL